MRTVPATEQAERDPVVGRFVGAVNRELELLTERHSAAARVNPIHSRDRLRDL
jgi:hypothetical protein